MLPVNSGLDLLEGLDRHDASRLDLGRGPVARAVESHLRETAEVVDGDAVRIVLDPLLEGFHGREAEAPQSRTDIRHNAVALGGVMSEEFLEHRVGLEDADAALGIPSDPRDVYVLVADGEHPGQLVVSGPKLLHCGRASTVREANPSPGRLLA